MEKKRFYSGLVVLAIGILGFFFMFHGGFEGGIISGHIFKNSLELQQTDNSVNFNSGPVTGYSILDNPTNKLVAYGIFLAIIVIGVILIVWSNWHDKKKEEELLGRKGRRKRKK